MKQAPTLENQNLKLIFATRRPFVFALILMLISFSIIFFVGYPEVQNIFQNWEELQKSQAKEKALKEKLALLQQLETSPDNAKKRIVDQALPSRKPLYELLLSMNQVAQQTQVQVDKFELNPGLVASSTAQMTEAVTANKAGATPLKVKYTVRGTFNQINDYLRRIEEVTPFTTLMKLAINTEVNDTAEDQLFTAGLESETYYFVQQLKTSDLAALPKLDAKANEAIAALESYAAIEAPVQAEIIGGQTEIFGETIDLMGTAGQVRTSPTPASTPQAMPTTASRAGVVVPSQAQ